MENEKKRKLALFDLDGTLTFKDTFLEFIKYFYGEKKYRIGLLLLAPFLVFYKLRLMPNWKAKERVLIYFFKNTALNRFQKKGNEFAREKLPLLFRENALAELKRLQNEGVEIWIVSASTEYWIRSWCEPNHIGCITTRLMVRDGKLTGRIEGKNCYGREKANRIREQIDLSQYEEILAYGDSKGDLYMLKLATESYYKAF